MESPKPPLPPLQKTGIIYLMVLFVLAIGFYLLLLAAFIAYGAAFYFLILATPAILKHSTITSLRIVVPMLVAMYTALVVFSVAIFRGVFARSGAQVNGIIAHRAHHQPIFTAVREVAEKVGARPL